MIGPVRVFLVLRESPQLDSLAAIAAVSALFAATPFIIPAVALEYSVSLGRSGLLSAAQVGGFAVAVFVAGRRLRTHRAYLNGEIFYTLPEAVVLVEQWRRLYNTVRPHSAWGAVYRPAPEAVKPSSWFLRMPQLQGPPMAQRLT